MNLLKIIGRTKSGVWFFITPSKYYIPNKCKYYKDSTEIDGFALAAIEHELRPRKPVHFFLSPLILGTFLKQKTSISINKDDKIKRDLVLLQLQFLKNI